MSSILRILVIIIVIMLGTYYCMTMTSEKVIEPYTERTPTCPDILIQKDGKIVLFASKLQTVPGVNPLVFDNLEDYVEFTKWQRSNGITCPVLYLQNTHNVQGGTEYRVRPDIEDPQGGLAPSLPSISPPDLTQLNGVNDAPYFKQGGGSITGERALNTGPETIKKGTSNIRNFVQMDDQLDSVEDFVKRIKKYNPHRTEEHIRGNILNNIKQLPNGKWTWKYDSYLRSGFNNRNKTNDSLEAWKVLEKIILKMQKL